MGWCISFFFIKFPFLKHFLKSVQNIIEKGGWRFVHKNVNHGIIYNWKYYNQKKSDNMGCIVKVIYLYIIILCSNTQKIDYRWCLPVVLAYDKKKNKVQNTEWSQLCKKTCIQLLFQAKMEEIGSHLSSHLKKIADKIYF